MNKNKTRICVMLPAYLAGVVKMARNCTLDNREASCNRIRCIVLSYIGLSDLGVSFFPPV